MSSYVLFATFLFSPQVTPEPNFRISKDSEPVSETFLRSSFQSVFAVVLENERVSGASQAYAALHKSPLDVETRSASGLVFLRFGGVRATFRAQSGLLNSFDDKTLIEIATSKVALRSSDQEIRAERLGNIFWPVGKTLLKWDKTLRCLCSKQFGEYRESDQMSVEFSQTNGHVLSIRSYVGAIKDYSLSQNPVVSAEAGRNVATTAILSVNLPELPLRVNYLGAFLTTPVGFSSMMRPDDVAREIKSGKAIPVQRYSFDDPTARYASGSPVDILYIDVCARTGRVVGISLAGPLLSKKVATKLSDISKTVSVPGLADRPLKAISTATLKDSMDSSPAFVLSDDILLPCQWYPGTNLVTIKLASKLRFFKADKEHAKQFLLQMKNKKAGVDWLRKPTGT